MVPVGDSSTALTEAPGLLIPPYAAEWISVQTQGQHKLQIKALFFPLCLSNSFFLSVFQCQGQEVGQGINPRQEGASKSERDQQSCSLLGDGGTAVLDYT